MRLEKRTVLGRRNAGIRRFRKNLPLLLLALPAIIYLFVFNYIPLYGLVLPFKNYQYSKGFFGSEWVGLENFKILLNNKQVLIATRNTFFYNLTFIIVGTCVAVVLALMLYEMTSRFVKVYQTMLLLPHFISWVIVAYVALVFLDMDAGLFNEVRKLFGAEPILWYNSPKYWPPLIVIFNVWKSMGFSAIMYYASLMGVDQELFEAAKIDGAGKLKQMWHIAIPSIKPLIITLTILNIGKIFYGDFGLFYNLPQNSPLLYSATDVIDTYVYRTLTVLGDMGISSAVGFYQSVLGFILVLLTNWVVNRIDSDNALF